jgi:1-acyl-sn-glycerol-3-phosphate acyltransferase
MGTRKGARTARLGMLSGASGWRPPGMALRDELRLLHHGRDWRGRSTAPRSAEPWVPEVTEREFPTAWARSRLTVAVRAGLTRRLLRGVVWSQTETVVEGTSYLDELRGPALFIANHSSHLDTPLILGSLPKRFGDRVAVGAAADYFFDTRWRAVTTALLFNAFPVERYGSRRLRSLASDLVDEGWSLLIFPEGTRSEDGWMSPFRIGTAYLAVGKNIPVVPIAICGSYAAMPRGRNWPQPGRPRITIRYGRPLHPAEGEKAADFRRRMAEAVARLAAEESLGWYAALRAAAGGTLEVPGFRSALPAATTRAAITANAESTEPDAARTAAAAGSTGSAAAGSTGSAAAGAADGTEPVPARTRAGASGPEAAGNGAAAPVTSGALMPVAAGSGALAPRDQEMARWRRIWTATAPAPRKPVRRVWR